MVRTGQSNRDNTLKQANSSASQRETNASAEPVAKYFPKKGFKSCSVSFMKFYIFYLLGQIQYKYMFLGELLIYVAIQDLDNSICEHILDHLLRRINH